MDENTKSLLLNLSLDQMRAGGRGRYHIMYPVIHAKVRKPGIGLMGH